MTNTTVTSKQFSLNMSDFVKGIIVAVIVPVLTTLMNLLTSGELINWSAIWKLAVASFIGYLLKNFFTPSAIVVKNADKELLVGVKEGDLKVTLTKT